SLLRGFISTGLLVSALILIGVWLGTESRLHAQNTPPLPLVGAWSLNGEASDHPDQSSNDNDNGDQGRRRGGGGGFGGGRGRFGGGFGGGGFGGGRGGGNVDPERMARMREAMRELLNAPNHLTIVQNGNTVVMTGPDGRTTRLATDGKKIKDES